MRGSIGGNSINPTIVAPEMPLTNAAIRNAKPGLTPKGVAADKPYKMSDAGGMYLEVSPAGGKWWRLKYRILGKEKRLSLGTYPDVSLAMARARRDDARRLIADGIDPSAHRRANKAARIEKAANSFEVVAREWYLKKASGWNEAHGDRISRRLERDVFPWIGNLPIAELTAPNVLGVLRRIEARGAFETAHRALGNCSQVFRYAIATDRAASDPTRDLRGALQQTKGTHFAAVTDPKKVGPLLRALRGYQGSLVVQCALKLAPLLFVRPGELRKAKWKDIDLEAAEWRYLVTKSNTEHIVPLAPQAVEVFEELRPLTGNSEYVFPSARSTRKPMSDNAILAALRRLDIDKEEMTGHGFRAMARTILDEILKVRPELIEHQLAHTVRDPNGRAYNRTAHLPERRKMMIEWANWLDAQILKQ